ncbi:MAG TPA: PilT/PilU family type 4a pilus ATPase, partial [Candidatus Baltobacteraceae bacterium]|nr:PilT/PilU family type 4a pilus ATPase [Candidatus Baltobacteraceae bacterium]
MTTAFEGIRFSDIVHVARGRNASDIHLAPGAPAALRIDGALGSAVGSQLEAQDVLALGRWLLGEERVARIERGEDVSMTRHDDDGGALRVHGFRVRGGMALSLRLLHDAVPALESLHLPDVVASLANRDRGLVIFAGPTGSGKSTSLAAVIDRINRTSARRIITIEDPIEYRHANVKSLILQREIGVDAPTFSQALKGALRADPDVIMVGEMRDAETMQAALNAAETGHLVLSTLHTGDATQTVDRILDSFSHDAQAQVRAQLAAVLSGVVCQHLVPRAGGPGRRVVAEVLVANDAVRGLVREARTHLLRNVLSTGRRHGMQTLEHHASELLARGAIGADAV